MTMKLTLMAACTAIAVMGAAARVAHTQTPAPARSAREQVFAAERAFARSLQDRDLAAFSRHLSKDAIFYGDGVARGPAAVAASWKPFFDGPTAPASVEVTDSGTLALSSGPVRAPDGQQTATFNSVWRLESDGVWRVVFDKGCRCPPPAR